MKKIILTLLLKMLFISLAEAQNKPTISGTLSDASTGETLIGATVSIQELPNIGTISNAYGYYSMELPQGDYHLIISYLGYHPHQQKLHLTASQRINVKLRPATEAIAEVVVLGKKKNHNIISAEVGTEHMAIKDIQTIPAMFGEADIMKTMTLTSGVKSAGEGNGDMYVRGGNGSQNLIQLDEATVYNTSHMMGFFSTFNSDAIKNVALYKGTAPAQYGGRTSSVMDIKMNEGNNQEFHLGGGIGLLSADISAEGPIVKDKGSFLITARRTYADMYLKLSEKENLKDNQLYFYDLNLKANYKIDDNNRLFLSGYAGKDVFDIKDIVGVDWGNLTGTLRWNHIWNEKLFSNTSIISSRYDYESRINLDDTNLGTLSVIKSLHLKHNFQYYLNPQHTLDFGLFAQKGILTPGQLKIYDDNHNPPKTIEDKAYTEYGTFLSHTWKPSTRFTLTTGLRFSAFHKDKDNQGQGAKTYYSIEPRFNAAYIMNPSSSFKLSYTRNTQNLHLVQGSNTSMSMELWLASSEKLKPEISDQLSLGYFKNLQEDRYQLSAEVYYRWMQNQVDLKDGADTRANDEIEDELCFGSGRAYGLELMFKKKTGRLTGWLSYTLSRSEKQIENINNNDWYPARQDATHDFSIVGIYQLSPRWTLSATWVYNTGNAVTYPSGKYSSNGETQLYYTERNGYRMPDYHRLDLGATYTFKKRKKYESSLSLSLYNAYGRKNAYMINFKEDPDHAHKTIAEKTYLFSFMPSISYQFKF